MTLLPHFFRHPHKNDPPSVTGKSAIFLGWNPTNVRFHQPTKAWLHLFVIANGLILYTAPRMRIRSAGVVGKGGCVGEKVLKIWAIYPQSPWFSGKLWKIFGIWVCSNDIVLWSSQMHEIITGHHSIVFAIKRTQMVFCTNNSRNLSSKRGWFNQSQD